MSPRRKLLIVGAILAAGAFAGGAYAATSDTSPKQAFLSDVAKRLRVTPQQLQSAIQGAFSDQLNAAVKADKLTPAQAKAIEQHIKQHGVPPFPFFPGRFLLGPPIFGGGLLSTAASYIGISDTQLLQQLRSGKSLAQIAKAHGKTASGLERAAVAGIRSKLDRARTSGRISSAQEQRLLGRFQTVISRLIDHAGFRERFGPRLLPPRFGP